MKRLTLSLLLGVLCLALLSAPTVASLYDHTKPLPVPFIDIGDDLNNADIGWGNGAQKATVKPYQDQSDTNRREHSTVNKAVNNSGKSDTGRMFRKVIFRIFILNGLGR